MEAKFAIPANHPLHLGQPLAQHNVFPPLESVTKPAVPNDQAAFYLCRRPQTLRAWACLGTGPIRPIRIHGRLAWRVSDLRALLNGGAQ